jgi:hypothetical protein
MDTNQYNSPYVLNSVRSLKNYGLYITGSTVDPIWSKGFLNSKPNFSIQGSTCYIDYSHVSDISDKIYFKRTFSIFGSSGETFAFSSSRYYDENANISTT